MQMANFLELGQHVNKISKQKACNMKYGETLK